MRGQATVELALASVVFVAVLLIGIHMAEYSQLSLKVQDAQAFAVWEATGRRVQDRKLDGATSPEPFRRTMDSTTGVGFEAQQRFADFDGLATSNHGNVIGRALTQGRGVKVSCEPDRSLSFPATMTARPVLLNVGGLRCTASAEVRAINIPRRFMNKAIVREEPIPVCGMGLPVNGVCEGSLSVLTNDWGLFGDDETKECKNDCDVSHYRGLVRSLWAGGGGAGRAFAERFAGTPGTDANEFQFSYAGIESDLTDYVGGEGLPTFITGGAGAGMVPKKTHPKCFLGKACP